VCFGAGGQMDLSSLLNKQCSKNFERVSVLQDSAWPQASDTTMNQSQVKKKKRKKKLLLSVLVV
jgi:hypothetical protein